MPFDGIVTKAVVEELEELLIPGKITKVYQPTTTEILLIVRSNRKNYPLLFSIHSTYARFHITNDTFQNPKEPYMFCMVMRKYLTNAIIKQIEQVGMERVIRLSLETRNELGDLTSFQIVFELMGRHSNFMLVDNRGIILDSMKHISQALNRYRTILPGSTYQLPPSQHKANPLTITEEDFIKKLDFNAGKMHMQMVQTLEGISPVIAKEIVHQANLGNAESYKIAFTNFQQQLLHRKYEPTIYHMKKEDFHVIPMTYIDGEKVTFTSVNEMLDSYYSGRAERERVQQRARDLYRLIKNEKDKNERKLIKHQKTIKKADQRDKYQKLGELLTAHLHLVSKGDTVVTVIDYYDPHQKEMDIPLDSNKTPSENAQFYFNKYQKLKKSKVIITKEIARTKTEIIYLEQLLQQIEVASEQDIEEIREELREEGYLKQRNTNKKKKKKENPKLEQFIATDGTEILVGKNNKQNEYLTNKVAHRNDIWLHTKDIPGSHVVIRSHEPSEETLVEAAQLAAYFSKAQQSSTVPVDYTQIRHVHKPKGAKPGFVTYEQQKTVYVTPSEKMVKQLKK
ncbi:fibronectin/fibrinogen-binding protein [Cerasibacillus terrae]|uniref:Rqc2 homolog RqcH n=1 Tax=Cerasibacillus terrae TaxID=2498845 RepID=A0A5C8P213_9BACI|nr:NFACT RNA binding domain-containing protein [Cerasibacillus terrae]TXL67625.1 fibronectin/fibrinogen-binding protein [Cerasibacillus terrae]